MIGMLPGSGRRWRKIRHAAQAPIGDSCKQGPGRSGNVHGAQRVHSHRGTGSTRLPFSAPQGTPPLGSGSRPFDARRVPGRHTLRIIRLSSFPKAPQRRGYRTRDVPPGVGNRYLFLLGPMVILVGKGVVVLVDGRLRCTEQNVLESSVPLARNPGPQGASAAVTSLQANARVAACVNVRR